MNKAKQRGKSYNKLGLSGVHESDSLTNLQESDVLLNPNKFK